MPYPLSPPYSRDRHPGNIPVQIPCHLRLAHRAGRAAAAHLVTFKIPSMNLSPRRRLFPPLLGFGPGPGQPLGVVPARGPLAGRQARVALRPGRWWRRVPGGGAAAALGRAPLLAVPQSPRAAYQGQAEDGLQGLDHEAVDCARVRVSRVSILPAAFPTVREPKDQERWNQAGR